MRSRCWPIRLPWASATLPPWCRSTMPAVSNSSAVLSQIACHPAALPVACSSGLAPDHTCVFRSEGLSLETVCPARVRVKMLGRTWDFTSALVAPPVPLRTAQLSVRDLLTPSADQTISQAASCMPYSHATSCAEARTIACTCSELVHGGHIEAWGSTGVGAAPCSAAMAPQMLPLQHCGAGVVTAWAEARVRTTSAAAA